MGLVPHRHGPGGLSALVLQPLEPVMQDVTVFQGLSHPRCRAMNGHDTGDTFLTGNNLAPVTYQNTVSLDQYAAREIGRHTHASLTLSTDGGVGPRTRTTTLSYTDKGQPIAALSDPKQILSAFLVRTVPADGRESLQNSGSILDLVRDQSKSPTATWAWPINVSWMSLKLPCAKWSNASSATNWLDVPCPRPTAMHSRWTPPLMLPRNISAPFTTYNFSRSKPISPALAPTKSAATALAPARTGCARTEGRLARARSWRWQKGAEKIGRFDQFLTANLARFINRLKDTPKGDGTMLDRTLVMYGSSNSRTHQNRNYPLLLAGGRPSASATDSICGLMKRHRCPISSSPCCRVGRETEQFVDSTGPLAGLSWPC